MNNKFDFQIRERFWEKVDIGKKNECWGWTAGKQSKGYGSFGIDAGKTALAHRVAYEMEKGEIPKELVVRHSCDNKLCCNPGHLEIGTVTDNNRDAQERGRTAKGEKNGQSILNTDDVMKIRSKSNKQGITAKELARDYKVHPNTIYRILREEYWKLPEAE